MRLILESNEPHYEALNGDPCVAKPTILPGDPGNEFVSTPVESDDEADDELAQAVSAQAAAAAPALAEPAQAAEPARAAEPAQAAEAAPPAEPGIHGLAWPIYPPLAALAAENIWKQGELARTTPGFLRKLQARTSALERVHAQAQAGEMAEAGGWTRHERAAALAAARGKANPRIIRLRPKPKPKNHKAPAWKGKGKGKPGKRPPMRASMPPDPPNPPPDPRYGQPKQPSMPPPGWPGMPNRPCPPPWHFPADLPAMPPEMPPPTAADLTEQEDMDCIASLMERVKREHAFLLDLVPSGKHRTETEEMRSGH